MSDGTLGSQLGKDPISPGWSYFFWGAALFNWVVGLIGMFAPVPTIDARIGGLLVFAFGVIFALVARDPGRYGSTLWAGVIGKAGIVALLAPAQIEQDSNGLVTAILALEAVFAAGFLAFLITRSDGA